MTDFKEYSDDQLIRHADNILDEIAERGILGEYIEDKGSSEVLELIEQKAVLDHIVDRHYRDNKNFYESREEAKEDLIAKLEEGNQD